MLGALFGVTGGSGIAPGAAGRRRALLASEAGLLPPPAWGAALGRRLLQALGEGGDTAGAASVLAPAAEAAAPAGSGETSALDTAAAVLGRQSVAGLVQAGRAVGTTAASALGGRRLLQAPALAPAAETAAQLVGPSALEAGLLAGGGQPAAAGDILSSTAFELARRAGEQLSATGTGLLNQAASALGLGRRLQATVQAGAPAAEAPAPAPPATPAETAQSSIERGAQARRCSLALACLACLPTRPCLTCSTLRLPLSAASTLAQAATSGINQAADTAGEAVGAAAGVVAGATSAVTNLTLGLALQGAQARWHAAEQGACGVRGRRRGRRCMRPTLLPPADSLPSALPR